MANEATLTLPLFDTDFAGHLPADVGITLPAITIIARSYNGSPPECVVMNTKTSSVSEYKDYAFNRFARVKGVDLAANQNGIYTQDTTGLDDAVYKIKAHIKTKRVDVHNGSINRLRNAYLIYESDGDVRISSVADKAGTRAYYLALQPAISGIRERRVKFERGVRNRHFDFKIENIDGSSLEVDKFTIHTEPIISKRR